MGHAGSSGSITLDVYSKTWWSERVEAVSRIVEAVLAAVDEKGEDSAATPLKDPPAAEMAKSGNPLGNPRLFSLALIQCK
jgi:hypothetical protein